MMKDGHRIVFYSPEDHPRIRYVVRQIFEEWLGLEVVWIASMTDCLAVNKPVVEYAREPLNKGLWIPAHPYLSGGEHGEVDCFEVDGLPALFRAGDQSSPWPFDLLSLCFFLLSRHEEYYSEDRCDYLGRFPASASIAMKYGFLSIPLVDKWVNRLGSHLTARYPGLQVQKTEYRAVPTYDIDYFWAYQHRSLWHKAGGLLKSVLTGKPAHLRRRLQVLTGKQPDPFYTFEYLHRCHQQYSLQPLYFVLVSDFKGLDRANAWHLPAVQKEIQNLGRMGPVGLHPSVASNRQPELIKMEKSRLEHILGKPVEITRQHYLCLSFPQTYRRLCDAGFSSDYSLGYADMAGFRASTSRSFLWYDIEREQETGLRLHPFGFMDVALRRQSGGRPEEAITIASNLVEAVRNTGGTVYTLWHNSSFYDLEGWLGWQAVFESVMQKLGKNSSDDYSGRTTIVVRPL